MYLTSKQMEIMDINWMDFCKITGTNEWCRAEGQADESTEFEITDEQLIKLLQEKS